MSKIDTLRIVSIAYLSHTHPTNSARVKYGEQRTLELRLPSNHGFTNLNAKVNLERTTAHCESAIQSTAETHLVRS